MAAPRLKLKFSDATEVMREYGGIGADALTTAMRQTVTQFKNDIRPLVRQNFKRTPPEARQRGLNFEKSFQGATYPLKKRSYDPAGFLYAKAKFAEVFEEGAQIHGGRHSKYLTIALAAARKFGLVYQQRGNGPAGARWSKWSNVELAENRFGPLRILPGPGSSKILAASTDRRGGSITHFTSLNEGTIARARGKKRNFVPLFLLIKQTRAPKLLSFRLLARNALSRLPRLAAQRMALLQSRRRS